MVQNWEYKILRGERKPITEFNQEAGFEIVKQYENELNWSDDGRPIDNSISMITLLSSLGSQGWELFAILPRSLAISMGTAGITTEEVWIFKRPKN